MKFTTVALLVSFLVSVQAAPSTIPSSGSAGINADVNLSLSDVSGALQRVWKATSCLGTCRSSWGWTGHHLGSDPYGAVLKVGDPVPYSDTNNQANAPSYSSSSSSSDDESSTSTSDAGLSIQDVTLSAEEQSPTVQFSVYSVTRVETTTSTTPTSSSIPPPAPTTTSTQDPPPPSPTPTPTTSSTQVPAPSPTPDQSNDNQAQNNGSQNDNSASTNNGSQSNNSASTNNSSNQGSTGSTSASDQQQYLDLHNVARSQHGASAVTWSDELEGFAQEWANNCQFMHSGGKFGRIGENLAAGTGNYGISDAVGAWMAEQSQYNPSNPVASHFTQVVWKGTTQIGCASATCSGIFPGNEANFIVCEYNPAGNVLGEFAQNVQ